MPNQEVQIVYVRADDRPASEGELIFTRYHSGERLSRAAKALLGCWAAAGVTVLIPIAHFVLVPGFFIAGPVLAYTRYQAERTSDAVKVDCPSCCQKVTVEMEASEKLPVYKYCPHCRVNLHISEK